MRDEELFTTANWDGVDDEYYYDKWLEQIAQDTNLLNEDCYGGIF